MEPGKKRKSWRVQMAKNFWGENSGSTFVVILLFDKIYLTMD
jgi:hypothetical protein